MSIATRYSPSACTTAAGELELRKRRGDEARRQSDLPDELVHPRRRVSDGRTDSFEPRLDRGRSRS